MPSWQAIGVTISLIGLLIVIVTGAVKFGHRDAKIEEIERSKLDRTEYYQDIGDIKADIRILRCSQVPQSCVVKP